MNLPPTRISTKLQSTVVTGLITTVVVGFLTESPLKDNQWLRPLQNNATTGALVVILSGIAGYRTPEKAFDPEQ